MKAGNSYREEKAAGSFLASAVGDAIGWPFEGRARKSQSQGTSRSEKPTEFSDWIRSGSRSQPYREPISAGEYSDDTQLLLSTARSILHGRNWWTHFTSTELPFWLLYERGGGGATKRAAQSWLAGKAPWESSQTRKRYLDAGGNGVAMRILPHLLASTSDKDPCDAKRRILQNGLSTHGHPRALVGALLHGMTLWHSLRQEDMLEFGALANVVYKDFVEWAQLSDIPVEWEGAFSGKELRDYKMLWDVTIKESMELIETALDGLKLGPLSAGHETLGRMGALNPRTNGSGTISAAAALFVSSRYAATPLQGMLVAATANGADTDTVASMCGSILGAIHGGEWLGNFASNVQDSKYIKNLARCLVSKNGEFGGHQLQHVTKKNSKDFEASLSDMAAGSRTVLPDGRHAILKRIDEMYSETAKADLCFFECEDGQTLATKRIARRGKSPSNTVRQSDEILRVGIRIYVSDLELAQNFYVCKLGLRMTKEYSGGFTVAEVISIQLANFDERNRSLFPSSNSPKAIPCIRVSSVSKIGEKLAGEGVEIVPVVEGRSIKAIRVADPFGNEIEFFEARKD